MEGMTGTTSVTGRPDGRNERTLTTPTAPPDAVRQTLGRLLETVGAGSVFAAPVVREDVTVIPCAEVMVGLGMGQGSGTGMASDSTGQSEGSGAGGGGGGTSRPVAAIVITQGQVRVEPIVDATKVALAGITTLAFMGATLLRISRMGRETPPQERTARRLMKALGR
jgi:uncharacterized spore protein YtfJ